MPKKGSKKRAVRGLGSRIAKMGVDALLVSGPHDIRYLAGFYSAGNLMLVKKKGLPVYFVDSMNRTLAAGKIKRGAAGIITADTSVIEALARHIKKEKIKKLGFDSGNFSVRAYEVLRERARGVKLVSGKGKNAPPSAIREIRQIKRADEIRILRRAAKETVSIWRKVKSRIRNGSSEKDIAVMIDTEIRRRGFENSFPTIAAIGANTAYPHAIPGAKRLKSGQHVLVDFGIRYQGYCSDLTRTYYKGRINRQIQVLRKNVLKARDLAIKEIKPGAEIGAVVKRTYNIFNNDKLSGLVLHGLGHGVGLEVHEEPYLRAGCRDRLKEGMVITVEPGLYKPGTGGVREEDMVLVTRGGCEVLTK